MKVIYFINAFNRGGAEIGMLTLLKSGMFDGIDLKIIAICRGTGEIIKDLESLQVPFQIMYPSEVMTPRMLLGAVKNLLGTIKKESPDAIILSLPQANIVGRIAATLGRVRNIISFEHNTHLSKPVYEKMFRWTSGAVSMMLADSATTGRVAAERLYRSAPPVCLTVPLVCFKGEAVSVPSDSLRIVSAGRLTETKNHQAIIRAVAILRGRGLDVALDILGEGPLRGELEDLRSRLGIEDLVALPGFKADWTAYAPYRALVMASHHEGLCIVALEGMHRGIPVVASVVGGMRDYMTEQNTLIVPENTPEAIADAVEDLIANPERGAEQARSAHEMVLSKYGVEATRAAFKTVNKTLLALESK